MLIIRLQRVGKKHQPTFRLVVGERRRAPQGKYLEGLGWYNPRTKEYRINEERVTYWASHGAVMSDTASRLVKKKRTAIA